MSDFAIHEMVRSPSPQGTQRQHSRRVYTQIKKLDLADTVCVVEVPRSLLQMMSKQCCLSPPVGMNVGIFTEHTLINSEILATMDTFERLSISCIKGRKLHYFLENRWWDGNRQRFLRCFTLSGNESLPT